MAPRRMSGLQKDVLVLYRELLRSAKAKNYPTKEFYNFVRAEFREKASEVSKTDFKLIEHSLRKGYKQKKLIDMPGFSGASYGVVKHSQMSP